MHWGRRLTACGIAAGLAGAAGAQEATNTPAATQPAQGSLYGRQKVQYVRMRDDPSPQRRSIDKLVATTALTLGVRPNVALSLDVPLVYEIEDTPTGVDRSFGVYDIAITLKYRPLQIDLNPIDSVRLAFFGGVEVPSGDRDFSSHSFDPFAGAVFTAILGRHGVNQAVSYKLNTGGDRFNSRAGDGPANALRYDTAYLFRLAPSEYTAESTAATYITFELNGLFEGGDDHELMIGPGLLYEARAFALEASIAFPLVQDVDMRPSTELLLTFGARLLF